MNAVSLFAGVGGFDLALERAGVPDFDPLDNDTSELL